MTFLKTHLFFVCLAAAVIVLAGGLLGAAFKFSGDVDEQVAARRAVANELGQFSSEPYANTKVCQALATGVALAEGERDKVRDFSIDWNKRNFDVLQLSRYDEEGNLLDQVPAFPIDDENYHRYGLRRDFNVKYEAALKAELKRVNAIGPPSLAEISRAEQLFEGQIKEREQRQRELEGGTGPAGGSLPSPMPGGQLPPPGGGVGLRPGGFLPPDIGRDMDFRRRRGAGRGRPSGRRGGGVAIGRGEGMPFSEEMKVSEEARYLGAIAASVSKANTGLIYATLGDLGYDPSMMSVRADNLTLWERQVKLWVIHDILSALQATSLEALKPAPGGTAVAKSVPNSPIKRLVGINVYDGYIQNAGAVGRATGQGSGGFPAAGGGGRLPAGGGGRLPAGGGGRLPAGGGGGAPAAAPARRSSTGSQAAMSSNLSRRISNARYDVKHYVVSVIMDPQYAPNLVDKLAAQNYHTVLNWAWETAEHDPAGGYYYGTDPIMKVTIKGELLLLTAWGRGQVGSTEFPPIMPKDVLIMFAEGDMRPQDSARLGTPAG